MNSTAIKNPNWQKSLQEYLLKDSQISKLCSRIAFLKAEQWEGTHIVFNEWTRQETDDWNVCYEKGIDIFPVLIDIVVPYEEYQNWYLIRRLLRKKLGKFNWLLTQDREGTIAFKQHLAPEYNPKSNMIVLGNIYLFKQNYDYSD